jgi:hypothetical protein
VIAWKQVLRLLRVPDYTLSASPEATLQQDFEDWMQDEVNCYALHIDDFSGPSKKIYCIPLIDLAATALVSKSAFEDASAEEIASRLPKSDNKGLRHVQFPQTRYSFLSDEVRLAACSSKIMLR